MMNYLISAYSVNPYKGSEDSIGWNWVLQYEKNYKEGDRIILLTKKFNEMDTRRGFKEFNIQHVELVIVDVPDALNWFREKYSAFHHMYYILWQHWAWLWVKHSEIHFDVIHHVTMNDYRIPSEMLHAATELLAEGGRLSVITYHSLEDRIVKNVMKAGNPEGKMVQDFFGRVETPFKLVNNKVILPSDDEQQRNPRSRSAKLRIAEKK